MNPNAVRNWRAAPNQPCASWLQIPFFEFLRRRAERAELVNGRACGRKGERLKRFGEHLVKIRCWRIAGADVGIELRACPSCTNVDTYSMMAASMSGLSCPAVNAPMGPVPTS